MDPVIGAHPLGDPVAVLAEGGVMAVAIRDRIPQWHELRPEFCRLGRVDVVDIAHVGRIGVAAGNRVAAPDDLETSIGHRFQQLVDAGGIGRAPFLGAKPKRGSRFILEIEAVIGAEHRDRDIGFLMRNKILDRSEPLAFGMNQRGAGMRAVEDAEALVLDQDSL